MKSVFRVGLSPLSKWRGDLGVRLLVKKHIFANLIIILWTELECGNASNPPTQANYPMRQYESIFVGRLR